MKFCVYTYLLLSTFIMSCQSKESSKNDDSPKKEPIPAVPDTKQPDSGQPAPDNETEAAQYGYVGKCLSSVSKIDEMDHYIKLEYDLKCSPVFNAATADELKEKLNNWKTENCPQSIKIKDEDSCKYQPNQATQVTSTDELEVDIKEHCTVYPAKTYGQLVNNWPNECKKQVGVF